MQFRRWKRPEKGPEGVEMEDEGGQFLIILPWVRGEMPFASNYQQYLKVVMQRRRLLRANRTPANSFDESLRPQSSANHLLPKIQNQNLFHKLVGITLQFSREAGLPQAEIQGIETKLLSLKGIQKQPLLNRQSQKIQSTNHRKQIAAYDHIKKYGSPEDLSKFIQAVQVQVKESQGREHIIFALKKYIADKKKTLSCDFTRKQATTRAERFNKRIMANRFHCKVKAKNCSALTEKQIMARIMPTPSQSYQIVREYEFLISVMGHSFFRQSEEEYCPVFNVIFDNTQNLIISAGEDGMIKIWSRYNGALLANLRGHKEFISKICMSKNNKYLLSSGHDGVRFFDISTMSAMGGYVTDDIVDIGEIIAEDSTSYIAFANDSHLFVVDEGTMVAHRNSKLEIHNFNVYSFKTYIKDIEIQNCNVLTVNPENYIFLGFISGEILITNFNKLKDAIQTGEYLGEEVKCPEFKLPIEHILRAHEGDIVEIKWNPVLSYFCTGSKKDGVCKVWQMKNEDTQGPMVIREIRIPKLKVKRKKKTFACNFVCWNCTYNYMACSFIEQDLQDDDDSRGDGDVVIYNAIRGEVTWEMGKTIDLASIKCMDSHPKYANVMLICDNNGKILIADIYENLILNMFEERAFHLLHPEFNLAPSQCRFSQDGLTFVVSTEYGNISIYGYDIKQFYHVYPTEQFFQTEHTTFDIHPENLKPVYDLANPIDINELPRGQIQNARGQNYRNLTEIDFLDVYKQITNPCKMRHVNDYKIDSENLERLVDSYNEHEKNNQLFRKNIQDLENKRLAIMYEEQECRQQKFEEILKEKIEMIKAAENIIFSQKTGASSEGIVTYPEAERVERTTRTRQTLMNQEPQVETRRRGRQTRSAPSTLTNRAVDHRLWELPIQEESEEMHEEEQQNYFEEDYEGEENDEEQEEDVENQSGRDDEDESSSEILYPRNRRDRNNRKDRNRSRNHNRRPQQQNGRSSRNRSNNHNNNNSRVQDTSRVRKRNPQEDIQSLMNDYEEFSRIQKRVKREQYEQNSDDENKKVLRRSTALHNNNSSLQKQGCFDCGNAGRYKCELCKGKTYCESCKGWHGKKYKTNNFCCFNCIFKNNQAPEAHRNLSHANYVLQERGDLFIPQVSDQVVYFFQGYEQFLADKVELLNNKFIYEDISIPNIAPHEELFDFKNPQKLTVAQIKYCFPLQQVNQLTYQFNRGGRGRFPRRNSVNEIQMFIRLKNEKDLQFWIYFIPGYEYIVKWEIYQDIVEKGRYRKLQLFDMAMIKDESVQIMEIRPLNPIYQESIWKNIIVHKGESKNLRHKDKNQDIAVNIWNINEYISEDAFRYTPQLSQYTISTYAMEIDKIAEKDSEVWNIFSDFVNTEMFPAYYEYVEVGICLELIMKRLRNSFYQSEESFFHDIQLLVDNAIKFNGEPSYVADLAQKLSSMILKGEDFNPVNHQELPQEEEPTEKKNNSRKRGTTSPKDSSALEEKRRKAKVSHFSAVEPDSDEKALIRNRRRHVIDSDHQEGMEEELDSSQLNGKNMSRRLRARVPGNRNHQQPQVHRSSRVTRSRTKNN